MQSALKIRLIGAAVLIALAVIIVPLFFSAEPSSTGSGQSISLNIPQTPDQELQTRTMSVAPQSAASAAAGAGTAQVLPGDKLATVTIPSRRPQDVHPEASARSAAADPDAATPATTAAATQPGASQPVASPPSAPAKQPAATPAPPPAQTPKPATASPPATAGAGTATHGSYRIDLGAYASRSNAEKLVAGVRKLGYPVNLGSVSINGKPAARVDAGPFSSRAAAEAARLKIRAALPRAPAKLVAGSTNQKGDAPASALPAHRAGGWAVQIIAYSKQADADKLRARLRAAGFDGYVDDVMSGGKKLWRVRVGPQTQRADAQSVRDQIKAKMKLKGVVVTVP